LWEGKKGRGNGKAEKVGEKKEGIKGGGGKEIEKEKKKRPGCERKGDRPHGDF